MSHKKRAIHPIDFLFLSLEKRRQPMHVAGLLLFKIPPSAPDDFVQKLAEEIRQSKQMPMSPFGDRLNGLFWQQDERFDIDHHFRHIALPKPGRIRELFMYVSQEHSTLLDRAKPMWTCTLIEGIEGNRFAIYCKIHHALVDGVAAFRLLEKTLSSQPDDQNVVPLWCLRTPLASPADTYVAYQQSKQTQNEEQQQVQQTQFLANKFGKKLGQKVGQWYQSSGRVLREVRQHLAEKKDNPDYIAAFNAPACILNQKVSASRRFAAQSYDLQRLRQIAQHFNVKMNDVILAICAGALREYLKQNDQLPSQPLISLVPASIRQDDSDVSNRFTLILASLATHLDDPVQRLYAIQRSVQQSKQRFARMSANEIWGYTALLYGGVGGHVLSGLFPKYQSFNLVISSVISSKQPMYLKGAALEALYPASVVFDGQALNITMGSYLDKLEVGIVACRQGVPRIQQLLHYLELSIQNYEAVIALDNEKRSI